MEKVVLISGSSSGTGLATAIEEIVSKHGRIDILINNAGYSLHGSIEDIIVSRFMQKKRITRI